MKDLAKMFSFFGQYKTLIQDLIDHFRYGNGNSFHSQELNLSFHERINKYDYNSPIRVIKECIENDISSTPTIGYRPLLLQKIKTELLSSRLNKFNDFKDNFNGLGISTHDISAQKISLLNFQKYPMGWSATIYFFYAASIIYGHCVLYRFCIHTLMLAIQSFWSLIICHGLIAIK